MEIGTSGEVSPLMHLHFINSLHRCKWKASIKTEWSSSWSWEHTKEPKKKKSSSGADKTQQTEVTAQEYWSLIYPVDTNTSPAEW